ncbi:MAG: hypothetical protein A3G22_04005 [Alphaproteobacteria bacterium RIFCSPLOWO2_12_FULL_40_11]|nr:MAG: hypothetical protein A3G22_04005 [Alphaproteobacteria bacterium RIFCSPLOWO2_12_FULL_40_11]
MKYYKELLTIGIPAYNEEKYIAKTIESCVNQAGCVIISDNASTDNTGEICQKMAQKYSNLIYICQEKNIGGAANFNFLLKQAKTKYFMWLGGHDYLDDGYSRHMIHSLENSDAVGCYPASRHVDDNGEEMGIYEFWYANRLSCDSPSQRVYALIAHLHEVSAFFGIYRLEVMARNPLQAIIGNDHVFVCNMALAGRMIYSRRSIYNWRQTKMGLSYEENIKIWERNIGGSENKIGMSRKQMKQAQINILRKAGFKGVGIFSKLCLLVKARKKLQKRFGD